MLSFVPADDVKAEVMQVTLTNTAQVPLELECVADIPIYGPVRGASAGTTAT